MGHYADKVDIRLSQEELRIITDALNLYYYYDIKEDTRAGLSAHEEKREKLRQRLFSFVELPPNEDQ